MTTRQICDPLGDWVARLVGRALAMGLHPFTAWRLRPACRTPMVVGYFVASYALVLGALLLL